MISGVIHGVIRPPVRATLSKGGGAWLRSPIDHRVMLSPVTGRPMTSPARSA